MSHNSSLKEVIQINETMVIIEGTEYRKHDFERQELNIIDKLVGIVDKLTQPAPADDNIITSLRVTKISFNNLNILGQIMVVTFGKAQKVTQTVTGFNAAGQAVPLGHLTGLTASIDNTNIATVGPIDPVNQTVDILGVADGSYNITYSGVNDAGATVTLAEAGTIADVDNVITSLQTTSSAPVAQ